MGNLFQLVWIEWKSKKLYDMQLPWLRAVLINLAWIACCTLSLFLPEELLLSIVGKFVIVILFVGLIFFTSLLKKEEKEQVMNYIKAGVAKINTYFTLKKIWRT